MKICLINALYKPYQRGGAEVIFGRIIDELKNDGHDVFVITISRNKAKKKYFVKEIDGVKIYRFYPQNIFSFIKINQKPYWQRFIWHIIDTFNFHSAWQLKKILKLEKPELVLTHNLKGFGYLTLRVVKKLKIKNIHTVHDVQLIEPSGLLIKDKERLPFLNNFYIKITRYLFNSPNTVIFPSRWLQLFYRQYNFFSKSKRIVLNNPLVLDNMETKKEFDDNRINFLFLGQLEQHKGIIYLCRVFKELTVEHPDCRLYIAGDGSLAEELKKRYFADSHFVFLGYVPYSELADVFKKIHFTVLPSLCYENSPGVIFDSFKFATPVIAAEIGGVPEIVQEGVNGYTFEPGNKINLLNKLKNSIENINHFEQMSENARIKAKEYDVKKYIYRLLSL